MIKQVKINNIATYKTDISISPLKINFIYGGNGTGKTTFSKILSGEIPTPNNTLTWSSSDHEEIIVYNKSFIDKNFSSNPDLPGIFTLGSESIEIQSEIEKYRKEQENAKTLKENFLRDIEKLQNQQKVLENTIYEECWEIQTKYGHTFADALIGVRNSKEKFFKKCIECIEIFDNQKIYAFENLVEKYRAAFTKGLQPDDLYNRIPFDSLKELDNNHLLPKIITGKSDTPIGTFIKFLNASDWIKQGIVFAKNSNGKCPYCQQTLPAEIQTQIEEFFDQEYEKDYSSLIEFKNTYKKALATVTSIITTIKENPCDYLSYDQLLILFENFNLITEKNLTLIQQKIDSPSTPITIDPIVPVLKQIDDLIDGFNKKIADNNKIIEKQDLYKTECKELIWNFLVSHLITKIEAYEKQSNGLQHGIQNLTKKHKTQQERITQLEKDIINKEAQLTSILPTVDAINQILSGFGFTGFSLAENPTNSGTYKIIRPDGSDAKQTLSEGEYNFISFLYFYHLCYGSQTNSRITSDKILVIDDPISSLDSNVLFIVSTLIKSLITHCRNNQKGIKQIFILTHNVYFHKEVTFLGSREDFSPAEVKFYIIRKKEEHSKIFELEKNPIMTSYELLWEDLRNPTQTSTKSVFNTMRRILEHYFQVIGGIKYEECINLFDGEDKLICKSLIAYINDGSHSIFDDLIVSFEDSALDSYLRVFKLVFEKLHHIDHYNMMMKISSNTD